MNMPPCCSRGNTFETIFFCNVAYLPISLSSKKYSCSGVRLHVPLPVQGASQMIPGNLEFVIWDCEVRSVTKDLYFLMPAFSNLFFKLARILSLLSETVSTSVGSISYIMIDLPPLPAQQSQTSCLPFKSEPNADAINFPVSCEF